MADVTDIPLVATYHYVIEHGVHVSCGASVTPHDSTSFDSQAAWVMGALDSDYVSSRYVTGNTQIRCVVVAETLDGEFYIKYGTSRGEYGHLKVGLGHADS